MGLVYSITSLVMTSTLVSNVCGPQGRLEISNRSYRSVDKAIIQHLVQLAVPLVER
jgi:hypothetical protein